MWQVKLCDPSLTRAIPELIRGVCIIRNRNRHFTLLTYFTYLLTFLPPQVCSGEEPLGINDASFFANIFHDDQGGHRLTEFHLESSQ